MDATTILVEAGMDDATPCGYLEEHALERGEDSVITVEGALILSQGLNDLAPFQRVMQQLPQMLCRDLSQRMFAKLWQVRFYANRLTILRIIAR